MNIKRHLAGGTLRQVMVTEVKRVLGKYQNSDQPLVSAALELGVTPKTLRQWRGPIDKGGWVELQIPAGEAMEAFMAATKQPVKKKQTKKSQPKKKVTPKKGVPTCPTH